MCIFQQLPEVFNSCDVPKPVLKLHKLYHRMLCHENYLAAITLLTAKHEPQATPQGVMRYILGPEQKKLSWVTKSSVNTFSEFNEMWPGYLGPRLVFYVC